MVLVVDVVEVVVEPVEHPVAAQFVVVDVALWLPPLLATATPTPIATSPAIPITVSVDKPRPAKPPAVPTPADPDAGSGAELVEDDPTPGAADWANADVPLTNTVAAAKNIAIATEPQLGFIIFPFNDHTDLVSELEDTTLRSQCKLQR